MAEINTASKMGAGGAGPEKLGVLIAIFIKGKNLPNRRKMGKQDPYCTARIAQNAQNTKTDKRGGQTPHWDHELRFDVYDTPDSQKMKVTVLDDNDARPELIGDALIDLKPAFERSSADGYDNWHPIMFKNKYAGEIFIEMTFYAKVRGRRPS
ncbi:C2 domain-containing protein [Dipodascopsis tothii]|uniref:C2 domain-containing protein n=1 Tax=Dipodascopsis tothii TaxID=44089 RepID=UPI0034CF2E11